MKKRQTTQARARAAAPFLVQRLPALPGRERAALPLALAMLVGWPSFAAAWQAPEAAPRLADARWAPFVGCWEPVDAPEPDAGLLCVRPAGEGVEMYTLREGETLTSDLLVADGSERPLRAEGCEGTESIRFSEDGRRAFSRSAYTCDGVAQRGSGVLSMASPNEWVDVRALEVDGERTAWVRRYRLVGAERAAEDGVTDPTFGMEVGARTARMVAHRGVGVDQVIEATNTVEAEAVQAWLAARGQGLEPNAADLERMADAGVPESVVDVVVAVSFPETFEVAAGAEPERTARQARPSDVAGYRGGIPWGLRPRSYLGYRMLGYGYGSGYAPFYMPGYGYGYGYPGYYGYRPGTVIIQRRDEQPQGRIVNGRGYTRNTGEGRDATPRVSQPRGGEPSSSVSPPRRSGGDARPAPARSDAPERRPARPRRPGGPGGGI